MANVNHSPNGIVDVGAIVRSKFVSKASALSNRYSSRFSNFKTKLEQAGNLKVLFGSEGSTDSGVVNPPVVPMAAEEGSLSKPIELDESSSSTGSDSTSEEVEVVVKKKKIQDAEPLIWPPPRKRAKIENVSKGDEKEVSVLDVKPSCPFKKVFEQTCGQCSSLAKYKCPGCGQFTCSLACCINHKRLTNCTGKKRGPGKEYIPKRKLTVNTILNDIKFLNHVQRFYKCVERNQLTKNSKKRCLRNGSVRMMQAAKERGTYLRFLPEYMERSRRNSSRFIYSTNTFLWHVELVFGLSRKPCIRVSEKTTMSELIDAVWLEQFTHEGLRLMAKPFFKRRGDLRFLLEIPLCSTTLGGGFLEVSAKSTLQEMLLGFIVLEFPIIHCVLVEDLPKYKCVSRDALSSNPELLERLDELHGFDSSIQFIPRKRRRFQRQRRRPYGGRGRESNQTQDGPNQREFPAQEVLQDPLPVRGDSRVQGEPIVRHGVGDKEIMKLA